MHDLVVGSSKAYAHHLKNYWEFLGFRGLDWREARLEDIGEFVAWLQLPPAGRSGEVALLPTAVLAVGFRAGLG